MHRVSQWFRSLYLVILILTILLCPISYGWLLPLDRAAAGVERQIDFTPQVTPLATSNRLHPTSDAPRTHTNGAGGRIF